MMVAVVTLLHEWSFLAAALLILGFCGHGALAPFTEGSKYSFLASPVAGMLLVPFGANTFYSMFDVSYRMALAAAAACCCALTLLTIIAEVRQKVRWSAVFIAALIGLAAVLATDTSTIIFHGPAITYLDGTDHGGYAHLADWLNGHTILEPPLEMADRPYDSWPAYMFKVDPRFGSVGFLAAVSFLYGSSGIFAYDIACAIALTAGIVGVAGLFANSTLSLAMISFGLMVSHWYDYAQGGFFGKVLGFPAALFIAGIAIASMRVASTRQIVYLAILASAAGVLHSGPAAALLVIAIYTPAAVSLGMRARDGGLQLRLLWLGVAVSIFPVISSGIQARPNAFVTPDYGVSLWYALPRMLDLENQGIWISGFSEITVQLFVGLHLLIWAILIGIAFTWRDFRAIGFLAGPAVLAIMLVVLGRRAVSFQLIGYFYPAFVCGAASLFVSRPTGGRNIVALLLLLATLERVPRLLGSVQRYAIQGPSSQKSFTEAEIDRVAADIAQGITLIDVVSPQPAIILLIELGRRNLDLQWSAQAWDTILHYRGWAAPVPTKPPSKIVTWIDTGPRGENVFEVKSR